MGSFASACPGRLLAMKLTRRRDCKACSKATTYHSNVLQYRLDEGTHADHSCGTGGQTRGPAIRLSASRRPIDPEPARTVPRPGEPLLFERILLGADASFAGELTTWCEQNRVVDVFGLARNARLVEAIAVDLGLVRGRGGSIRSARPPLHRHLAGQGRSGHL